MELHEAPAGRPGGLRPSRADPSLLLRASFCSFGEVSPPRSLCLHSRGNSDVCCSSCQRREENTSLTSISGHFISSKRKTIDFRELISCQAISPEWCRHLFLSQYWRFVLSESTSRFARIPESLSSSRAETSLLKHVCVNLTRLHRGPLLSRDPF